MAIYCYCQLSFVVTVAWEHFRRTFFGQNFQICHSNFDPICHSSTDNNIGFIVRQGACILQWFAKNLCKVHNNKVKLLVGMQIVSVLKLLYLHNFRYWNLDFMYGHLWRETKRQMTEIFSVGGFIVRQGACMLYDLLFLKQIMQSTHKQHKSRITSRHADSFSFKIALTP